MPLTLKVPVHGGIKQLELNGTHLPTQKGLATARGQFRRALPLDLVSLTTGWDGSSVVDFLSFTPLYQPATPGWPGPTIVSVTFDSTHTATRPHQQGGTFSIDWDSNTGVPVTQSFISIQPIHAIT